MKTGDMVTNLVIGRDVRVTVVKGETAHTLVIEGPGSDACLTLTCDPAGLERLADLIAIAFREARGDDRPVNLWAGPCRPTSACSCCADVYDDRDLTTDEGGARLCPACWTRQSPPRILRS